MEKIEGRAARAQNRTSISEKIEREIDELICIIGVATRETGELHVSENLTLQRAITAQQEAKAGIEAYYSNSQAKRRAYLAFGKVWSRVIAQTNFNVPPELPRIVLPTPNSMFQPEWMEKARLSHQWRDRLNTALQSVNIETKRAIVIDLAIASAIFHGLLVNTNHIAAFDASLRSSTLELRKGYHGDLAVCFHAYPKAGLVHRVVGDKGCADVTFVPDSITLGLIVKILNCEQSLAGNDAEKKSLKALKVSVFQRLQRLVFADETPPAAIRSLNDLCAVGFWPRVSDGADLSHALLAAMMGVTPTIGPSFQRLANQSNRSTKFDTPIVEAKLYGGHPASHLGESADQDVIALEKIISLSAKRGLKRHINAELRASLTEATATPANGSIARLLTDYLAKLVIGQNRKTSTFHTYATRLLHPLAIAFSDLDVRTISGDDFDDLYRIALDQKLSLTSRNYCARVLSAMHSFAVHDHAYQLPHLNAPLHNGTGSYTVVRAFVPNLDTVNGARLLLCEEGDKGKVHATILSLAFRSGLRIGEICKLRLSDFQIGTDTMTDPLSGRPSVWLWVRQNKYGDNKTDNARRKIPISALMLDNELDDFVVHFNRRKCSRSAFNGDLLFEGEVPDAPFHPLKLGADISGALRLASPNTTWSFHHLRHAALNAVHLVIEGGDELALGLFGWDANACNRVRRAIVGDNSNDVRAYHALAKFAGHATAGQTWASYLHFWPWLVALKRDGVSVSAPLETIASATGITARTLREQNATTQKQIAKLLGPKLKRLVSQMPRLSEVPAKGKITKDDIVSVSLPLLEAILKVYQNGASAAEVAKSLGLATNLIEHVVERSRSLQKRVGARGHVRVAVQDASQTNAAEEYIEALTIKAPRTKEGHSLSNHIFEALINRKQTQKQNRDVLDTLLGGINSHDSEIRFYHPDSLKAVINTVSAVLPASLFQAEIRRRPGRIHALALRRWRAALGSEAMIFETILPADPAGASETSAGTALVRVRLPGDDAAQPARATSALKYAAAMAWIATSR